MIRDYDQVDVFVGLDVGKSDHHAVALDRTGKVLFDRALPNDESRLREILAQLGAHGQVLVVVDQPATIGALPVAVARDAGVMVGYLPGLSMRRIADLHPGQAKTDARDAAIIAEAARSMPHTLRSIALDDEKVAELSMLCGFDDDLRAQITATSNRARGLLTQIHPALERIVGPRLDHPAVLDLIQTWPTPGALAVAGTRRISTRLRRSAPRLADKLAAQITAALDEQTVVVTGTNAAAVVLPKLAEQLVYAARLASYAGLAPVTRRSGTSIRGEHPSRSGNKVLKRALFLCAFAALRDPVSRTYYDRKRAEGKRHNRALIALARRRCDVLFTILRDGTLYDPPTRTA